MEMVAVKAEAGQESLQTTSPTVKEESPDMPEWLAIPPNDEVEVTSARDMVLSRCKSATRTMRGVNGYCRSRFGDSEDALRRFAARLLTVFPPAQTVHYYDECKPPRHKEVFVLHVKNLGFHPCCSSKPAVSQDVSDKLLDEFLTNGFQSKGKFANLGHGDNKYDISFRFGFGHIPSTGLVSTCGEASMHICVVLAGPDLNSNMFLFACVFESMLPVPGWYQPVSNAYMCGTGWT